MTIFCVETSLRLNARVEKIITKLQNEIVESVVRWQGQDTYRCSTRKRMSHE